MAFIQLIDVRSSDLEAMRKVDNEWEAATEGKRTVRRSIVCRDRNIPDRYVVIVFFDSFESAMENSQLPETQALSVKYAAAMDGPPVFTDLDVIDDRS